MKNRLGKLLCFLFAAVIAAQVCAIPASAASAVKLGDVDMNGVLDASDARYILRMSVKLENYTYAQQKVADMDANGVIDAADARNALRTSLNIDTGYRNKTVTPKAQELYSYAFDSAVGSELKPGVAGPYVPAPIELKKPEASSKHGVFTFTVYGWGDGVGMTQYGAVGMARDGFSYDRILKHYYTGVKLLKDSSWQSTTYYAGTYVNTRELVARIVYQEIYGIVDTDPASAVEALKAQTVCVYTLLKYHNFSVNRMYTVGYATSLSYSQLPSVLKNAVDKVLGEYLVQTSDSSNKPIEAVYSAMACGSTASSGTVWGYDCPYLQPVSSPYEMSHRNIAVTFTFTKEKMYDLIKSYDSSIVLSSDPANWIEIVEHSGAIDEDRGYVARIRVGNRVMQCYSGFCYGIMEDYFLSTSYFCASTLFCVTYTP